MSNATRSTSRSRRAPWVFPVLVALIIALPILEVWLLIKVGHLIGAPLTIVILFAEAVLGGWLLRREGSRAWKALTDAVQRGSLPVDQATDAALVLVGGVLLMLPGFLTDVFGLVFLLPFTRPLARRIVQALVARRIDTSMVGVVRGRMNLDGQTIDGEVVDDPHPPASQPRARQIPPASDEVVTGEVLD